VVDSTSRVLDPIYSQRADSIAASAAFEGETYFCMVAGGNPPDTTWLRQAGQQLLTWPPLESRLPEDPELDDLTRALRSSFPWRVSDFALPAGASWPLLQAEDTLEIAGLPPIRVTASVSAASLGRFRLDVPAGSFDGAHGGRLTIAIDYEVLFPGFPVSGGTLTLTEETFVMDGVGIVLQREIERDETSGTGAQVSSTTSRLRRFRLAS
jgi:hypothetical protein